MARNYDQLVDQETFAACDFFRLLKGCDTRGQWERMDLGEVRDALDRWIEAREEVEGWSKQEHLGS